MNESDETKNQRPAKKAKIHKIEFNPKTELFKFNLTTLTKGRYKSLASIIINSNAVSNTDSEKSEKPLHSSKNTNNRPLTQMMNTNFSIFSQLGIKLPNLAPSISENDPINTISADDLELNSKETFTKKYAKEHWPQQFQSSF